MSSRTVRGPSALDCDRRSWWPWSDCSPTRDSCQWGLYSERSLDCYLLEFFLYRPLLHLRGWMDSNLKMWKNNWNNDFIRDYKAFKLSDLQKVIAGNSWGLSWTTLRLQGYFIKAIGLHFRKETDLLIDKYIELQKWNHNSHNCVNAIDRASQEAYEPYNFE